MSRIEDDWMTREAKPEPTEALIMTGRASSSFPWLTHRVDRLIEYYRIVRLARQVAHHAPRTNQRPVIFFNASTRISGLSLNACFSLLTSWAVRLAGVPVVHFVCCSGMSRCVLGTDLEDVFKAPPCGRCVRQSHMNTTASKSTYFLFQPDAGLEAAIRDLDVEALARFEHPFEDGSIPLGALVLPSIRWRLRIYNLDDDEGTRFLFREFIRSAWNVTCKFNALTTLTNPQVVVVFNGQFFPEAVACWIAAKHRIRVVTHEVGLQPMSGFFTTGEATAYPITIPGDFALNPKQNARLDAYLEKRFQGRFSMAGIQFWPEMKELSEAFLQKVSEFKQIVPVFTNVIFDTSQRHSNDVFPDMFAWLETVLETIRKHPETLFVLRAHPDESRPGKAARESVALWVDRNRVVDLPNVVFVPPDEYLSSYELIQRAKFVMIYNSTIGLEATIMGAAVLCAGKARFTHYRTVFIPPTQEEYRRTLETFLMANKVESPPEHRQQGRRFLYYQLFRTSLPFDDYVEPTDFRGYVRLKPFHWKSLLPTASSTVQTLLDGILGQGDLILKE